MKYEVVRTNRRSICIQIMNNNVIVRCNKKTPIKEIESFLLCKKNWINSKINSYENNLKLIEDYDKYFLGNKCYENIYNYKDIDIKCLTNSFFKQKLDYFSYKLGVNYANFKLTKAKSKWGSCNSKGIIMLNIKLIHLKETLIDYVIIHELCHLKEFNHSSKFWNLVENYCPNYKTLRKELKNYTCILQV